MTKTPTTPTTRTALAELFAQRLKKPQRHRLLQGFPSAPLMGLAVPPSLPAGEDDAFGHAEIPVRRLDGRIDDNSGEHARHWLAPNSTFTLAKTTPETPKTTLPHKEQEQEERQWHTKHKAKMHALQEQPSRARPPVVDVDRGRKLIKEHTLQQE